MFQPMTKEQAAKLKPGDNVMVRAGSRPERWRAARVVRVTNYLNRDGTLRQTLIEARRIGVTPSGRKRPVTYYWAEDIAVPPESLPANIFADWLEERATAENNFAEAAAALRREFPIWGAEDK